MKTAIQHQRFFIITLFIFVMTLTFLVGTLFSAGEASLLSTEAIDLLI